METVFKFESTSDLLECSNYRSLQDLHSFANEGWPQGMDAIQDLLNELSLRFDFKQDIAPATEGLFFDIGLVCIGTPEHWFSPQPINKGSFDGSDPIEEETLIRIGMNMGIPFGVSPSSIIERGAAVTVLVECLSRKMRLPISLTQYYRLSDRRHSFSSSVVLKPENEELVPDILSFWCCSPDSFFRFWPRLSENTPTFNKFDTSCVLDTYYGEKESDIFIPGFQERTASWTRADSINWLGPLLQNYGVRSLI